MKNKILYYFFLTIVIVTAFGCTAFKSSQRLDLKPFANSMITVAGEIQYSLLQHKLTHMAMLKPGPDFIDFKIRSDKIRDVIKSIISYSIQIVTLSESNMDEKNKAAGLADYLQGIKHPVLKHPTPELNISQDQMDAIIENVRKQKNLLDALGAAQPIIDEVANMMGDLADEAKEYLDLAYLEIKGQWKDEYGSIIWADKEMKESQLGSIGALYFLKQYRIGESTSIDSVFIVDPQLREVVPKNKKVTIIDIMELEKRLVYKLSGVSEMRQQFRPDMEMFYKGLNELEEVKAVYNKALKDARNAVILWSRAHNEMAKGVTDPAQIDILGLMMKAASAVPVPGI